MTPNSPLPSRVRPLRITLIRPEEQLREQRGDDHRDQQRRQGDVDGRTERGVELLPHQHRRHADANRSKCLVAERHLPLHVERAAACE